jgi:hypothetical protein
MWQQRAERGKAHRKTWEERFQIETCERFFLGDQGGGPSETGLTLNHFLATVKTIRPSLYYQAPKFFVRPKPRRATPRQLANARVGEGVLESIAGRDGNLKQVGKLAVAQAFFRIGVLKVVYDPRLEPNPAAGEIVYQTTDAGEPVLDAAQRPLPLINPLTGQAVREPADIVMDDTYRWDWVDAAKMILPDQGPDPSKWTWIAEEITIPLEDAKEDPGFTKGLRSQLVANAKPRQDGIMATGRPKAEAAEALFTYIEGFDLRRKRRVALAEGQPFEGFLRDDAVPEWIEDHPYGLLFLGDAIMGPDPFAWPLPPTRSWIDPQREYNIRRRQIMEGAKRSARKGIYDAATFENPEEAVKLMQSPDDMVFAKVQDVGHPPAILAAPDLNPAIYRDIPMLLYDWVFITGQSGPRVARAEGETATEATFVERAANLRGVDMQDLVNDWLAAAGRKMLQAVKATLTLDMWIRIREATDREFQDYLQRVYGVDPQQLEQVPDLREQFRQSFGHEKWVRVTREAMQFEADVTVSPGSARPRGLAVERGEWLQFLQLLGQFPQLALSRELLRQTAEKFETISDAMVDELHLLAKQMMAAQQQVAGRDGQPGASPAGARRPTPLDVLLRSEAGTR